MRAIVSGQQVVAVLHDLQIMPGQQNHKELDVLGGASVRVPTRKDPDRFVARVGIQEWSRLSSRSEWDVADLDDQGEILEMIARVLVTSVSGSGEHPYMRISGIWMP